MTNNNVSIPQAVIALLQRDIFRSCNQRLICFNTASGNSLVATSRKPSLKKFHIVSIPQAVIALLQQIQLKLLMIFSSFNTASGNSLVATVNRTFMHVKIYSFNTASGNSLVATSCRNNDNFSAYGFNTASGNSLVATS